MKVVIVGGVAGGMSAAARLRRLREDAEIIVIEKGPFVSFANCGLPYYIGGEIEKRSDLLVATPEQMRERYRIDVRTNQEVLKINANTKELVIKKGDDEYALRYDKLILSPGAKPFIPSITGIENATNVFSIRNVPDIEVLDDYIKANKAKRAVVIGAGYIGTEMAENLKKRGLHVTLVEKAPQILVNADEEMAAHIERELLNNDVQLIKSTAVVKFEENGKKLLLDNGKHLSTDLTIMAIGVRPDTDIAIDAKIQTNAVGGILVTEYYETSVKDIYAVGDAIVVKNWVSKQDAMIALASPANRQGRQVADNVAGIKRKHKGSLGTAIVRVFEQVLASTGMNERQLKAVNMDYSVIHVQGKNHAGYFPHSTPILLKVLFSKVDGKIYGAQAVGKDGVDKRIDVIATAIKANQTIYDLVELELSYAPPFGSAKDVVNIAGYAAMNIVEGFADVIQWYDVNTYRKRGAFFLDVRSEEEYKQGHIQGFEHIPLPELRKKLNELPKDKDIIVCCFSGMRSYLAERLLKQHGFQVKNLDGAYSLYAIVRPEEIQR